MPSSGKILTQMCYEGLRSRKNGCATDGQAKDSVHVVDLSTSISINTNKTDITCVNAARRIGMLQILLIIWAVLPVLKSMLRIQMLKCFSLLLQKLGLKKTHQNIIHLFLYSKTRLVIPKIFITDSTSSISRNGNGTISCSLFQLYVVSSWHTSMKLHRLSNIHNYKSQ